MCSPLQETKAREDQLPLMGLQSLGYDVAAAGFNQWNGVAIISRVGLDDVRGRVRGDARLRGDPASRRGRSAPMCGGVRLWSLYVPNGRKVDDPHYDYKLEWLARLREAARSWLADDTALVGDWNIAPLDEDVFDMAAFARDTHVTPPERAAFRAFLDDGYADVDATAHPRARACTRTGTTTGSGSSATAACASTSCSAPRRWPPG